MVPMAKTAAPMPSPFNFSFEKGGLSLMRSLAIFKPIYPALATRKDKAITYPYKLFVPQYLPDHW